MGNPLRFYGLDHEIEIDGTTIPPHCAVEVTFRTRGQQYLLRPDPDSTRIIKGCFARAHARYPHLAVVVTNALSNHGSFLCIPPSADMLSSFMRDFLSAAAVQLNQRWDRSGTFWERRYRAIPVADEIALEGRFRYILTQGTKENLVWRAEDWPGMTSIPALLGKEDFVGRWRDKTAEYTLRKQAARRIERAEKRGRVLELPPTEEVWCHHTVEHVPMPHWAALTITERRARVLEILREDNEATRDRHRENKSCPIGVSRVLTTSPFDAPDDPKHSPAPLVHASTRNMRIACEKSYRAYVDGLRQSLPDVIDAIAKVTLPTGATTPPLCVDSLLAARAKRTSSGHAKATPNPTSA